MLLVVPVPFVDFLRTDTYYGGVLRAFLLPPVRVLLKFDSEEGIMINVESQSFGLL